MTELKILLMVLWTW